MPVVFSRLACFIFLALTMVVAAPALAHTPVEGSSQERAASLTSITVLLVFWLVYLRGAFAVRPSSPCAFAFHAALILSFVAVLGPLDEWAETNEAAHMTQHMLMMVAIAPLCVISRPLPQLMAGGGRAIKSLWGPLLKLTRFPMITAYLHGAVIWFWHLPYFYILALDHPWWHIAEHACFLLTAGLFWWAALKAAHSRTPRALLAVLFTLMHTGFLGALLTFAPEPLYGADRALADQQLAGLIMWVMGGIPYIAACGWMVYLWYGKIPRGG